MPTLRLTNNCRKNSFGSSLSRRDVAPLGWIFGMARRFANGTYQHTHDAFVISYVSIELPFKSYVAPRGTTAAMVGIPVRSEMRVEMRIASAFVSVVCTTG